MSRACLLLLVIATYGASVGCTACGTPYDYCSATFTGRGDPCGECNDDCRENVRLGSVFTDNSIQRMSYAEPVEGDDAEGDDQQPTEAEQLPDPEDQPTLPDVPLDTEPSVEPSIEGDEEMQLPELSDEPTDVEPLEAAPRSSSRPPRTLRR
jgi:hypothetical protein